MIVMNLDSLEVGESFDPEYVTTTQRGLFAFSLKRAGRL